MPSQSLYTTILQTSIKIILPSQPRSSTTVDLFAQEMKYLHDNGFKVLLLNQLGFDPTNNILLTFTIISIVISFISYWV